MSVIPSDAIQDALHRVKELTAVDASSNTSLKRPLEDESDQHPAKRANIGGGMDGGMVQMGGGGLGGPFMGGMHGGIPNDNVVEIMNIPDNTVGLVIGRGGSEIQNIQAQSGCRVQMSPESDPGSGVRHCTLQGNRMSVDRAKQMINEVITRAGQRQAGGGMQQQQQHNQGGYGGGGDGRSITVEMLIPATKCGLVIGKQGDTIKQLQDQSGVKMVMIQDSQEVTGQAKPLRITGDPDKIEHAKRLVNDLISSRDDNGGMGGGGGGGGGMHRVGGGGGYNPDGGATAKGEVVVPRSSVGMIIGKGGETIKRLAQDTGTKIQFKPDEDPNSADRCAVIMGTREQIYKATELITDLVHKSCNGGNGGGVGGGGGQGGGGGGQTTFFMHVPANKTGLVIGKGGETIKQINAESQAHCELSRDPPPNAHEKVFIIKGSPYQIHHAQHIIRIKVGDISPGTPVPPFAGPGGPNMGGQGGFGGAPGSQFGGGQYGGAPQMPNNQWNSNFNQQPDAGNGWAAQQAQPFYGGAPAAAQPAPAYAGLQQYQAPAAQQYAAPTAQPAAAAQPAAQGAPAINPQTGQPDYSAQWAEYYRSMGQHEQAAMIENQMKQNQTTRPAAQPTAAYGAQAGYPGAGAPGAAPSYAGYGAAQPTQFPQTGQFASGQPQQY